jgi:large subunit ribosomal protein L2
MAIKLYQPTTSGRRKASVIDSKVFSKHHPEKSLTSGFHRHFGRSGGKISIRHKGGGAKRLFRQIDFKQNKFDFPGIIKSVEYDPNRTCFIGLVQWPDGDKKYILLQEGLKVGDQIVSSKSNLEMKTGIRIPLKYIPSGTVVSNIEMVPGRGGQMVRSAGSGAIVMGQEGEYVQLKMPSSEIRLLNKECLASFGQISNIDHSLVRIGKAGRKRNMGIRPSVRGKVMNPVDHPHGGGEGKQPIGLKYPKTKWGKHALGVKTRMRKSTNKYILQRRVHKKK